MNEKLCLGTVQFGLQYGINNVLDRKPDVDECFDILDYAISMGIGCFDTASVYGNAEQIIGSYKGFNDNVKIISKLRPMLNDSDLSQDSIVQECENTLKRLDKKTLYGYLLHNAADMYNDEVLAGLHKCKKSGLVENIGVSTYTPEEAVYAVKNTDFNFIQIPYNVLDQRLNYSDFFELAKERNAKIFARSAFLQGLITMEIQQIKAKMPKAVEYVEEFEKICKHFGFTRKEAAFLFCYYHNGIDYVVFGVDTVKQLKENIDLLNKKEDFQGCYDSLYGAFKDLDEEIINPSMWVKK